MIFFEKILRILDTQMTRPTLFGWFHLMWIALVILGSLGLCWLHKKKAPSVPGVLLAVSVLVAVLEIYKQINYSFSYSDGIKFDYQWYAFPFQFCSTPMYIGLLAGIIRKGKLHDALCAYLATFSVFAGVCVTVYPGDVFIGTVGINIQTMICHGSMICMGVYLFYSGHVKVRMKTLLQATAVFAVCVALAALMNEIAYASGLLEREVFNMFFISPHCAPSLPVYSAVQNALAFPWCLAVYILAFTVAAAWILLIAAGVRKLSGKKQRV
ncbi:MAG: YwaF family protein [Oscillospiraceae bacterium]|nr:YwaF family protein [Oscillospiraceae bacterium]